MGYSSTISGYKRTLGDKGEKEVVSYLLDKGHQILDSNVYNKYGEIDIISIKDNVLYFFEVKTVKSTLVSAEEHMDWKKIRKTSKLAQLMYNNLLNSGKIQENTEFLLALACVKYFGNGVLEKIEIIEGLEV